MAQALASALLVLLGSAVTSVVAAGPAAAHDVLISTSPANGATVAQTPSRIVLTFTDPALPIGTQMVVTGPSGPVAVPKPRLVDNTVVQDLPASSPAGRYTVLWRVTSADGHPVSGEVAFTSRAAGAVAPGGATPTTGSPTTASSAASPEATAPAAGSESTSPSGSGLPGGVVVALVVVVAAVCAAAALTLLRRRRRDVDHG
ncbi:copper resistance CopC family protein [Terrabacter sp. NPDC080008]|uniref:copper resistance CopC family protein n=1 Tax=Terrabacter sp. NPDC080008 TaxID=3155176 RepID=UPI00344BC6D8